MRDERTQPPIGLFRLFLAMALVPGCVAFIWSNSFLSAAESSLRSKVVADFLVGILSNVLPRGHWILQYVYANVRKIAHAVEFFVLGMGTVFFFVLLRRVNVHTLLHALLIVVVVAVIDETIQSFTGRGDSVRDVVLDSVSGLAGIALMGIGSALIRNSNRRR